MKRILLASLTLLFALSISVVAQSGAGSGSSSGAATASGTSKKRGPVFRATKEQIKQAQTILKQRNFYSGEATGKLDADTRTALRKYQEAESLKVTGTLNRATLEKMTIPLTEKQTTM